jgi:dTDP-4-dehydrorhamnose reductase
MRGVMTAPTGIELWGGLECTINRVHDRYVDQLARCGHYARPDDLERIADLGIRRLRYPALWERVAADGLARADWRWCDQVLPRARDLGLDLIVGLVHHGSGPRSTHLLDPAFVDGLTEYAAAFAARYPWIRAYTPVNEPLTTARFSALYGHWYPHRRSDRAFVAALLVQCRAIASAMAAIRRIVPDAQLVQTEDSGSTRGAHALAEQAAFEEQRRWLSLDLLMGRVSSDHPLWRYLRAAGATAASLEQFSNAPTPPDIVGLNYYVTSDRYLDDRLDRYPVASHGGNGRQRYADVEASRVEGVGVRGHRAVLEEAWNRYRRPVAITEAHLGCTREQQMRWLDAAWRGAHDARAAGADVRAVTAWALLGSWDWNSLVTQVGDYYEPGAFDVRGAQPRPTALAGLVRDLAAGRTPDHAALADSGWWACGQRGISASTPPLVIVGATGTLGRAFAHACDQRGLRFVLLSRREMDITDPASVKEAVGRLKPWAVVNAAGYVRVDEAERDRAACRRTNAVGPSILAAACRMSKIRLLTFSSDLVFDGGSRAPYLESDPVFPLNIYGRTKAEAERRVLAIDPGALIVRTSAFFGPSDNHNFVTVALNTLAGGHRFRASADEVVSPTYVPDLVDASLDLLIDGAGGVWHLANSGAVTWAELAVRAAQAAGLDASRVMACPSQDLQRTAVRPVYSVLGTERGTLLPDLDDSLARYVRERDALGTAA